MLSRTPKSLQQTANTLFGRHPVPQHTAGTQNSTLFERHTCMGTAYADGKAQKKGGGAVLQ